MKWQSASRSNKKTRQKLQLQSIYSDASVIPIETVYPDFTGGFSNDLMYKNITLTILTNFAVGHKVLTTANWTVHDLGSNRYKITKWQNWSTWEKPGDKADLPQLLFSDPYNSRMESSFYLFDASYFKVQSMRLGYTFTKPFMGIKNLNVAIAGENIAILTKFPFGDSDTNMEGSSAGSAALDRYRPTRKILFSLRFDL